MSDFSTDSLKLIHAIQRRMHLTWEFLTQKINMHKNLHRIVYDPKMSTEHYEHVPMGLKLAVRMPRRSISVNARTINRQVPNLSQLGRSSFPWRGIASFMVPQHDCIHKRTIKDAKHVL